MTLERQSDIGPSVVEHPAVAAVLAEGRQAYLAVPSRRGPHATPALYSFADGRIGVFAASETVKAKVVRRREQGDGLYTGILVRTPKASAVLTGPVQMFDLLRPPVHPNRHLAALTLGAGFFLRNTVDLAAFARDALRGRTGLPPARRVLLMMSPDRAAVYGSGDVTVVGGEWPGGPVDRAAVEAADSGVAVFDTDSGLVPLPAHWNPETSEIEVASGLSDLVRVREGRASVVTDDYTGPGPAAKRGELVMGSVTALGGPEAGRARFRLEPSSTSEWTGVTVKTRR